MAETKLSLKLLIDKKAKKVLFAEAGKEFVDFLFYLLSLPAGTIISLLKSDNMVGCIGNLYDSLENLNEAYLQPNEHKNLLLKPYTPVVVPLLLPGTSKDPGEKQLYGCSNHPYIYVTDDRNNSCPQCKYPMSNKMTFVSSNSHKQGSASEGGVVKGLATYMVKDDLSVTPMSMISGISLLNNCNVKDFSALEERMVEFSIDEGLEMLKACLHSKTALTDVFIMKKEVKEVKIDE